MVRQHISFLRWMRYFIRRRLLQPTRMLWDWSATWRWYDLLLMGGFVSSVALQEYALAIICLALCALSCFSKVAHAESLSRSQSICAYIGITLALAFLVYVAVQEKGTQEWSHLSSPARGLYNHLQPFQSLLPFSGKPFTSEELKSTLPPPGVIHGVSPRRSSTPTLKSPRLGSGPDAYKDLDDAQVGQWAMEEADKIENLIAAAGKSTKGLPPVFMQQTVTQEFNDCCAQDVQDLRTEILRRLGPPSKDPEEIAAWTMLFPQLKYPAFQQSKINPNILSDYAPYLRQLGLRLKRREIPRAASRLLHFSEIQVAPDSNMLNLPYKMVVTITADVPVPGGYIVVEFDGDPGAVACDLADSQLVFGNVAGARKRIDNTEVMKYLEPFTSRNYALEIGKTPLTSMHVVASGQKPFHVHKITAFDE
jgi:hypothetical protein